MCLDPLFSVSFYCLSVLFAMFISDRIKNLIIYTINGNPKFVCFGRFRPTDQCLVK